ncbi:MAG: PilZ domain-containing protein [Spirochaetota bacterium]|jgi:hypothetical protein|nr:PilZ domain-containing protein [Spirochaetota bacterium]
MIDQPNKQELVSELQGLRSQVQNLEKLIGLMSRGSGLHPRAPRHPLDSEIEMIGDFDLIEAEGVDISDSGICFDLKQPLYFFMRFPYNGAISEKYARLVWVKSNNSNLSRLGFQFEQPRQDTIVRAVTETDTMTTT